MIIYTAPLPVGMGHDAGYDPELESAYECLDCGQRVIATEHPGHCAACGAELRNTGMPLE